MVKIENVKQIIKMKEFVSEHGHLRDSEIDKMNVDELTEAFRDVLREVVSEVWDTVKSVVSSVFDQFKNMVYVTLSDATGLEVEYLKENIEFGLAFDMLGQYAKQEEEVQCDESIL